ncbi:MAG: hypothetical protein J4G04_01775, partial [Nitrosopumilaceae archaeon]|nr:hypothetical protein [Nitrosopumilaceae archaeon]
MALEHGGGPDLVADDSLSLTDANRAIVDILADLESSLGAWSEYTTVNPETGLEHKRSWLTMGNIHNRGKTSTCVIFWRPHRACEGGGSANPIPLLRGQADHCVGW